MLNAEHRSVHGANLTRRRERCRTAELMSGKALSSIVARQSSRARVRTREQPEHKLPPRNLRLSPVSVLVAAMYLHALPSPAGRAPVSSLTWPHQQVMTYSSGPATTQRSKVGTLTCDDSSSAKVTPARDTGERPLLEMCTESSSSDGFTALEASSARTALALAPAPTAGSASGERTSFTEVLMRSAASASGPGQGGALPPLHALQAGFSAASAGVSITSGSETVTASTFGWGGGGAGGAARCVPVRRGGPEGRARERAAERTCTAFEPQEMSPTLSDWWSSVRESLCASVKIGSPPGPERVQPGQRTMGAAKLMTTLLLALLKAMEV